jgi:hypothetical protein
MGWNCGFTTLGDNAAQLDSRGRRHGNQESNFSHADTASTAVRMLRVRSNDMKPGVHVVLSPRVKVRVHVVGAQRRRS